MNEISKILTVLAILAHAIFAQAEQPEHATPQLQETQQAVPDSTQQILPDSTQQVAVPDSTKLAKLDSTQQVAVPDSAQLAVPQIPPPAVQEPSAPQEKALPKNTITVDFGPTIIGTFIGKAGELLSDGDDIKTSGFGIAAQYELQPFKYLSIAGRFAYLSGGVGYKDEQELDPAEIVGLDLSTLPPGTKIDTDGTVTTQAKVNLSSMSFEFHPRIYPFGGSFFLDGTIGYASMSTKLSGSVIVDIKTTVNNSILGDTAEERKKEAVEAAFTISRDYMKFGGKIGWRADFGKPGGFIFEHSYGWYSNTGFGKTMGKQMSKKMEQNLKKQGSLDGMVSIPSELDVLFSALEDFIFVGGPRVSFAFGWRF
ncbi:MAG: hypothetical protein LBH25_06195 [Fibromonadaceae bacterium]|jgi:hypothetical protein|nr:hypothetical protein [Fibromonadaceae bacterium]